jgi:hypothetical protein
MDAIYDRCCGLDIHKRTVVACLIVPGSGRQSRKEIRTFGTMTDDLLGLADCILEAAVQLAGGPLPAAAGERARYQAGAWAQD